MRPAPRDGEEGASPGGGGLLARGAHEGERESELKDLALRTGSLLGRMADEPDFAPPVYVLLTGLHPEVGWGNSLGRLFRKGEILGTVLGGDGEGLASEAAGAFRGEVRDLLAEAVDSLPTEIRPFLPAPAAADRLARPLSVLQGIHRPPPSGAGAPGIMGLFVSLPHVPAAGAACAAPASRVMGAGTGPGEAFRD
ncbi:MAG: hypothetical protein LBT40_14905 [Deltaproteobacteria bacterium]|nr:hypothetical protein [Deltaproteobacteria bacterium]